MARIAGVDLPRNKHANIALTYIYGIGNSRAARILDAAKVDPMKKVSDLGEDEVNRIRQVIEAEGSVEGDLRKDVSMNIKRLIEIGSYRGFRHRRNLPVRGQRTHTNARTRKGPRKGTVAQKKKTGGSVKNRVAGFRCQSQRKTETLLRTETPTLSRCPNRCPDTASRFPSCCSSGRSICGSLANITAPSEATTTHSSPRLP